MYLKYLFAIACLFAALPRSAAQEVSFADSTGLYNKQRIRINKTGLEVLAAWGVANIAEGTAGYFGPGGGEGKYFSEMNGIFGIVNTGLSLTGLLMVKKQLASKLSYEGSYNRYLTDKKIYLTAAGIDIIYIGAGVGLYTYGQHAKNDRYVYNGFGKSLALQGVFLLLFDNMMLLEHNKNSSKWYRIMDELRVTNNGVGFVKQF